MIYGYLVAVIGPEFEMLSGRVATLEEAEDMQSLWHVAMPARKDWIRVLKLVDL